MPIRCANSFIQTAITTTLCLSLCAPAAIAFFPNTFKSVDHLLPRNPQENKVLNDSNYLFENEPDNALPKNTVKTPLDTTQPVIVQQQLSPQELYDRAWAELAKSFVDKTFNGQDWNKWKAKYKGQLLTEEDAKKAIETLLSTLGDRNTYLSGSTENKLAYYDEPTKVGGVGLKLAIKHDKFDSKSPKKIFVFDSITNSPAYKAGIKKNWILTSVDGKPTEKRVLDEVVEQIRGAEGTTVTLVFWNGSSEETVTLTRKTIAVPTVMRTAVMFDKIGYLRVNSLRESTRSELEGEFDKLSQTNSLILDLRDCDGNSFFEALKVADLFLPANNCMSIVRFRENNQITTNAYYSTGHAKYTRPVAILMNRGTAGAPEIIAAALRDNGATTYGVPSEGNGTVQREVVLAPGMTLHITTGIAITPNRYERFHWKGLKPDKLCANQLYYSGCTGDRAVLANGPWYIFPSGSYNYYEHMSMRAGQIPNKTEASAPNPDDDLLKDAQLSAACSGLILRTSMHVPSKDIHDAPEKRPNTPSAPIAPSQEIKNEQLISEATNQLKLVDKSLDLDLYFANLEKLADAYSKASDKVKARQVRLQLLDEFFSNGSKRFNTETTKSILMTLAIVSRELPQNEILTYYEKLFAYARNNKGDSKLERQIKDCIDSVTNQNFRANLRKRWLSEQMKLYGEKSARLETILEDLCFDYHRMKQEEVVDELLNMRRKLKAKDLNETFQRERKIMFYLFATGRAKDVVKPLEELAHRRFKQLSESQISGLLQDTANLRRHQMEQDAERIEAFLLSEPTKANSSFIDYHLTEIYFKHIREQRFDAAEKLVLKRIGDTERFGVVDTRLQWWKYQLSVIDKAR